jgi:hypothetical protein
MGKKRRKNNYHNHKRIIKVKNMKRKGLGKGLGKGYKNIIPNYDSRVHSLSAKGIKQKSKKNPVPKKLKNLPKFEKVQDTEGLTVYEISKPKAFDKTIRAQVSLVKMPDGYGILGKGYITKKIGIDKKSEALVKVMMDRSAFRKTLDGAYKIIGQYMTKLQELVKAWEKDAQQGADLLMKKTLQKIGEKYKSKKR